MFFAFGLYQKILIVRANYSRSEKINRIEKRLNKLKNYIFFNFNY